VSWLVSLQGVGQNSITEISVSTPLHFASGPTKKSVNVENL